MRLSIRCLFPSPMGRKRARVCHASAADFEASFMKVREKVRTVIDKYSLTPVWIKN